MWVFFLVTAWVAAFAACARLCRVAATSARADRECRTGDRDRGLTLYETAFLAGGPARLTDVTLVSMSEERRMLLAHTGWATVVDPDGHDDIERSLITAIGPGGQSRIPPVRAALAAADAVTSLAERLTGAGLAVPETLRTGLASATRQVRRAALLVLAAAVGAELVAGAGANPGARWPWFALPLVLTLGTLAVARWEVAPPAHWASPAGERLLRAQDAAATRNGRDGPAPGGSVLTQLALRGVRALPQAELRAALGGARPPFHHFRG
ncbi:TIGR04222 domain-containing membrane protein [Streptomyces sp. DSM 42041]|uniref:TIGR04222 domain-containing membrane protein n=1 Tax=Streptomyces hazeniae TaxID=3075538 RepID=A0ABU2NYL7_9ACTN|nr:TIGR04222 domain-containing membrane protein [Streptomyces sp. DSM 42041]MDT0381293.1 TIGR04222 domain-containing membrane protein [Streptomyces sp. DSM 42041]